MKRNVIETIMGGVVIFVALSFVYTIYQSRSMSSVGDGYSIFAKFDDITGVSNGSDVRMGGVKVGVVGDVSLDTETYQAVLSMMVSENISIPEDSVASVVSDGLLGGKFVSLEAGGGEAMLGDGDSIEFTQSAVSLEQMIGKFVFSGGGVDGEEEASSESAAGGDDIDISLP